jgi:hypothetical protein
MLITTVYDQQHLDSTAGMKDAGVAVLAAVR